MREILNDLDRWRRQGKACAVHRHIQSSVSFGGSEAT